MKTTKEHAHYTKKLNLFMVFIAYQNILFGLNSIFYKIVTGYGPKKDEIRKMLVKSYSVHESCYFHKGIDSQSHMYTGIEVKIKNTFQQLHPVKIAKLFITLKIG